MKPAKLFGWNLCKLTVCQMIFQCEIVQIFNTVSGFEKAIICSPLRVGICLWAAPASPRQPAMPNSHGSISVYSRYIGIIVRSTRRYLWGVSLTFRKLSKVFSRNLCIAEIVLVMRISSWNFVRVPKAMLWAHIQSFDLKFSPYIRFLAS